MKTKDEALDAINDFISNVGKPKVEVKVDGKEVTTQMGFSSKGVQEGELDVQNNEIAVPGKPMTTGMKRADANVLTILLLNQAKEICQ